MLRQKNKKLIVVIAAFLSALLSNAAYGAVPVFEISSRVRNSFILASGVNLAADIKTSRARSSEAGMATAIKTSAPSRQPGVNTKMPDVGSMYGSTTFASLTSPAASYIFPTDGSPAAAQEHAFGVSASPIGKNWLALGIGMALIAYQLRRKIKSYGTTLSIG